MLDLGFEQSASMDLPGDTLNNFQLELFDLENNKHESTCPQLDHFIDDSAAFEIDSDTFRNNINEGTMLLNEFDGTFISNDVTPPRFIPADLLTNKNKPKILSDDPFNYETFKNQQKTKQQDFEQYLKPTKLQKTVHGNQKNVPRRDEDKETNKENIDIMEITNFNYNIDDWIIVKYAINADKSHFVHYIGKIMDKIYDTQEYKVGFKKKNSGKRNFVWPSITDEDTVLESGIVQRLTQPHESRRGYYNFHDLPNLNYK